MTQGQPGSSTVVGSPGSRLGLTGEVRRFTVGVVLRVALAVGLIVFVAVGLRGGFIADHGSSVAVQADPLTQVAEKSIDHGTNADCRATVAAGSGSRRTVQRIEVPCGVTKGRPFPAYQYADGTISYDTPSNRVGLWVVAFVIGAVTGALAFGLLLLIGLIALRTVQWREDR